MFLKSLELVGFKSFAKRTVLSFEPGITGIVGPNGSGKSNIADAIRWVLGAQSKKAVRGKVSADVIFSGSGSKPAMSLAEVSLVFDNSKKLLPYEYDEVVVTRRLYRSGDSEYLVNGSQTRLTDLQHAFAVAGIGAENYTVIGQGLVDRVLSQSARERRSLFEEAAGVRQFQIKRDEAKRKLTETTTNLSRVRDIVKELEPRLKLLRRQANVLSQKDDLETQLREAYEAKYGHRYRKLHGEYRTAKEKQADLNKEFMAISSELETLGKEVNELRRSQQGLKLNELLSKRNELRDTADKLREEMGQAKTASEVAQVSVTRIDQQSEHIAQRLSALQEHKPALPKADDAFTAKLTAAETDVRNAEARYGELSATLAQSATPGSVANQLTDVIGKLERAIEQGASKQELKKLTGELRRIAGSLAGDDETHPQEELVNQVQEALTKRDAAKQALHDLRVIEAGRAEAHKQQQAQYARHEQEVRNLNNQQATLKDEQDKHRRIHAESSKRQEALAAELKQLEGEQQTLEAAIAVEQQSSMGETKELTEREQRLEEKRRTHDQYRNELSDQNVELAKLETRLDDLAEEAKSRLKDSYPPADETELPPLEKGSEEAITKLERKMLELGGIDPEVVKEHAEVEQRFTFLSGQSEDLGKAKADLEKLIRQLERQSQTIFKEAFTKINAEFGVFFTKLFGGGKAELQLIEEKPDEADEEAPAEYGIDIRAIPPGKRVQNLSMLSGGERAMTSVALLFAILTVNPSPFVMLDEVDAALDEANTGRFAETLKDLTQNTQFLVVTHNRDTMRVCETLYGVTMDETAISTLLSIKLGEAEKVVQAA